MSKQEARGHEATEGLAVPRAALMLLQACAHEPAEIGPDLAARHLLSEVGREIELAPGLRKAAARRAAVIDRLCRRFLARRPGGLVVSVGSLLGTRAQRIGWGRWLDVDPPAVAAMRREALGPRPGYRQVGASLEKPDGWMQRLGRWRSPVLLVLEEPLLTLPEPVIEPLLDGIAGSFPEGTEVIVPTDRRCTLGLLEQPGSRPSLVLCNHTITYWPRLQGCEQEDELAADLEEVRRLAFLMRGQWVPSLLHLRID